MTPFEAEFCCILLICCGGHNKRDAKAALADVLSRVRVDLSPDQAADIANFILDTFDLAPEGSLKAYRDAVAKFAREYPYQG